jgi:hypothetical protein
MSNENGMGRRQFFSRFFPALSDTLVEKSKAETDILTVSKPVLASPRIMTNSGVMKETAAPDPQEASGEPGGNGGIRFPWVGM